MKAKIGSIEIEGAPEEIANLIRSLELDPWNFRDRLKKRDFLSADKVSDPEFFVSEEVAFRAIKRRSLSEVQLRLLAILRKAGDEWTTAKEIQAALEFSSNQFSGMLGAFGKRVTSTPGHIEGTVFFDQEWDYENDCNRYRLPASVINAVKRVGI